MTHKILKSSIANDPDFAVRVAAHAKEMRDWRAQMKLAAEHKGNDKIPEIERYVERPRPAEHPLVEMAVNENDEVDFAIIGPPAEQVLFDKKKALLLAIERSEAAAFEKVIPAGKMRIIQLRKSEIAASDAALVERAMREIDVERETLLAINLKRNAVLSRKPGGIIGTIVQSITGHSAADKAELNSLDQQVADQSKVVKQREDAWSDHSALLASRRDPGDHAFMLDYTAKIAAIEAIRRWTAQAMSDVEDLTSNDVDSWTMPSPPGEPA